MPVKSHRRGEATLRLVTPEEIGDEFDRITAKSSAYTKEKGWTDEMNEALLRGEYDDS